MPLFVILGNWTQKRMETIKDLPEQIKRGKNVFESLGIEIKALVFTLGRYDMVGICEAPDKETITKALLSWSMKGLIRTETLAGFSEEEICELVEGI
jgi:uncharacterized protein with GYD domain